MTMAKEIISFFERWSQTLIVLASLLITIGIGMQRLNAVEAALEVVHIEGSLPTITNSKDIAVLNHIVSEHVRIQEIQFGRIEDKLDKLSSRKVTDSGLGG